MKTLRFKTNIKCMGCVAQVTPHLNEKEAIDFWDVNVNTPEKILTVSTENLSADEIIETVSKAGFKAESIN